MSTEMLMRRIDDRLTELKRESRRNSERKLLLSANPALDAATIRRIRDRGQTPGPQILARLEIALGVPPNYFVEAVTERPIDAGPLRFEYIYVKGCVQAGAYRSALRWPPDEWYAFPMPAHDRYLGIERIGLIVRGDSMNELYPDGTIVAVARFGDLARQPERGERVIVLRREMATGDYEATIKQYDIDEKGRHVLWPRSTNPDFQSPFILGSGPLCIADGFEPLPSVVFAGDFSHAAGEPDIIVVGLVVGSYRHE